MSFRKNTFFNTTRITVILAFAGIATGLLVLAGWILQLDVLTTFKPGWTSMKVNTAFGIIFSGCSLLLFLSGKAKRLAWVLAILVFLLGAVSFSESAFNWDAHIDELMFQDTNTPDALYPGRVAPATSIEFLLIGFLLFLFSFSDRKKRLLSDILAVTAFVIGFVALVCYLYDARLLYPIENISYISFPASLSLVFILLAIIFSKPETGFMVFFKENTRATRVGTFQILLIISILLIVGLLCKVGVATGLYDEQFEISIMVVVFAVSIFFIIRTGIGKLNAAEIEKDKLYKAKHDSEEFIQGILSSLSSCVAVVDENGTIVTVNKAWENFAGENGVTTLERVATGANYFDVCNKAAAAGDDIAAQAVKGIQSVLDKEIKVFELQYPCHSPEKQRWFLLRVMLLKSGKPMAVLAHNDITEIILSKQGLEKSEKELKQIMDNSNWMIASIDRRHRLIVFNKALNDEYKLYTGSAPEPGIIIYNAFSSEGQAVWKSKIDEALAGSTVKFERSYEIGGQTKYSEVFLYPIQNGQPIEGITCFVMDITERREAQQALAERENYLLSIFETEPECIKLLGPKGELLDMNPAGLAMIEADNLEMLKGKSVLGIIAPEYRDAFMKLTQNVFKGEPCILEFEINGLKGTRRWLETHAVPLKDSGGKIISLLSVTRDISESKRAQDALKESETRYRIIVDTTDEMIHLLSADGKILWVNESWGKNMGVTSEEVIGKNLIEFLDEATKIELGKVFLRLNKGEKTDNLSCSFITKKGELIFLEGQTLPMFSEGKITGSQAFLRNVTERKKAEQRLVENERKLREITASIPGIVYQSAIGADGKTVFRFLSNGIRKYVNAKVEDIYKDSSILFSKVHPDDIDGLMSASAISNKNLTPLTVLYRVFTKEGVYKWMRNDSFPVLLEDGTILRNGSVIDITEAKEAEEKLSTTHKQLLFHVENAPLGYIEWDGQLFVKSWSKKAEKIFGWNENEFIEKQKNGFSLVYEEDINRLSKVAQQLMEGTVERNHVVHRNYTKDGRVIWCEWFNSVLKDKDGKIITIMSLVQDITERKKAEQELREGETKYRNMVERNLAGIYQTTQDGKILTCNGAFASMLGYTPEFLFQRNAGILYFPDDDRNSFLKRLQKNGKIVNKEIMLKHRDGSQVFLIENCSLLENEQTGEKLVEGVVIDITQRKLAEEKLKESEERYHSLVEQASDGILVADYQGNIIELNSALCSMFGYTREEIMMKKTPSFIDPEDLKSKPFRFDLLSRVASVLQERRAIRKDGNIFDIEMNTKLLGEGKTLSIIRDISERKKAEEQLREKESNFRSLVDTAPDATVIVDEKGIIQFANLQAVKLLGYTKAELTGMAVEMLMPQSAHHRHKTYRQQYIKNPHTRPMGSGRDLIAVRKDGVEIPVEISLASFRSEEESLITASLRDITQRKKAEKELEESYHSVRRLTEHLQNIREEERTHIAREIHDELGQQLTVMMMDVASLDKKVGTENIAVKRKIKELMEMLENTVKTVRKISSELRPSILDDLRLSAAMESHLKEFEKRSGIGTYLAAPIKELKLTNQVKNALFRIFQESLTNVARHSGAKKVSVQLEIKNNKIVLMIKDDGAGFDEKKAAAKRTLGVLGMKERAAVIGGEYIISGEPGKGTTILVSVPLPE